MFVCLMGLSKGIAALLVVVGMAACTQPQPAPQPDESGTSATDDQAQMGSTEGGDTAATGGQVSEDDEADVRAAVEAFGEQLKMVSVLAPDSILVRSIREHYGPLVTPELLAQWTANPKQAPGKDVSSPWPERIEITNVEHQPDGSYRVQGQVIYITSVEANNGGAASKEDATVSVVQGDDGKWLVSGFES